MGQERDRLENEAIWESLGIYYINKNIEEYRDVWKDHVLRSEDERLAKEM